MIASVQGTRPEHVLQAVRDKGPYAQMFFDELRKHTSDGSGITRAAYGEGEEFAHRLVAREAERLGLEVTRDHAANTYLRWVGRDPTAPAVMLGSHMDSVAEGGNYDGAAGVIAGLVAISALKNLGFVPLCDIIVMAVRAEESVWFRETYVGSRAALGTLSKVALEARRVDTGRTLAEHIDEVGGNQDAIRRGEKHLDPRRIRAFLELHIEQAPSLIAAEKPVAICTGIPGNFRYPEARVLGVQGHVGQPRRFRRDAAMAACDFAMALDKIWEEHEAKGVPMAFTLGRFGTDPDRHAMTIVPGEFRFSLDMRAYDASVVQSLHDQVVRIIAEIEAKRGVRFDLGRKTTAEVGLVDPDLRAALEASAGELGISWMPLGSPASHDAAAFAAAGVPVAMVFVRNANGSHNPEEAMELDDFLTGASLLTHWLSRHVSILGETS